VSAAPPTIADFAADTDFSLPALSPSGELVAFVTRVQGARAVVVLDTVQRQRRPLMPATSENSFEVSWCGFKTDDRLLCGLSGTQFASDGQPYPVSRLVSLDVTGKTKNLLLIQNSVKGRASQFQDRILDWQINEPKHVMIALSGESGPFPAVHSLDVYNGRLMVTLRSHYPILSWSADRAGVVRFGAGFDEKKATYITRDSAEDSWRTLARWELGAADFDVLGFGAAPGTMLVSANHEGRAAVFQMDLTEKTDRQLLFSHAEVDVDEPIYWPVDRRIVGFRYDTELPRRMLFDEEAKAVYESIDAVLPKADNRVVGASRNGNRLLIATYRDSTPTTYYLHDVGEKRLSKVGNANPALANALLSPMKPVKIKAADGAMLPGYLTLPPGSSGKNVPMVVYPHGGPHARDRWGFDFMVQFLASRGYAVLQVNFRGSIGYGWDWYEAGLRNWGTVMVDDITAATRWAVAEGIADPAHMCIVGWSYGGYAALTSAAREPDLYKCSVSIAGVSDLRALAREDSRFYGGRKRAEYTLGTDSDELKAGSPLRAVERIKAPVLMVHGDADIQVSVEHSRAMARALNRADKKHELVIIKEGNHSLSRFEWRETLLTSLERFLAENLGAGK
jgi:dipeptidyl aminopeptidase/acylaminoacyl peptidase